LIALASIAFGVCSPASAQGYMLLGAGSVSAPRPSGGRVRYS
jgi:hypothetical protein